MMFEELGPRYLLSRVNIGSKKSKTTQEFINQNTNNIITLTIPKHCLILECDCSEDVDYFSITALLRW